MPSTLSGARQARNGGAHEHASRHREEPRASRDGQAARAIAGRAMSLDPHPTDDLPAYALGVLDDPETVAAHVARCAVCGPEVAELQDALYEAAAAGAAGVEPPRTLRARIVLRHRGPAAPRARGWSARLRALLARPVPLAVPDAPA